MTDERIPEQTVKYKLVGCRDAGRLGKDGMNVWSQKRLECLYHEVKKKKKFDVTKYKTQFPYFFCFNQPNYN
jgi:hypothetical protein